MEVRGLSQRRACVLIQLPRSTFYFEPAQPIKDAPIIEVMRRLAAERPRFGYRRIRILMAREGYPMSEERCYRLWKAAGLQVPAKRPRRRARGQDPRAFCPLGNNVVWAIDFVHDACANGQKLKCLTVIDEYSRECLAIEVDGALRSSKVIDTLNRLISHYGKPVYLRSDNGLEFISKAILQWLMEQGIQPINNAPGKPWQNGNNESFNGKFRDECLSAEWFRSRKEAKVLIEAWRRDYNQHRPHSSLNYLTPSEFMQTAKPLLHHEACL